MVVCLAIISLTPRIDFLPGKGRLKLKLKDTPLNELLEALWILRGKPYVSLLHSCTCNERRSLSRASNHCLPTYPITTFTRLCIILHTTKMSFREPGWSRHFLMCFYLWEGRREDAFKVSGFLALIAAMARYFRGSKVVAWLSMGKAKATSLADNSTPSSAPSELCVCLSWLKI